MWTEEEMDEMNEWYLKEYRPEFWSKKQKDVQEFFDEMEKIVNEGKEKGLI
jgi:hypothetical protein